MSFYSDDSYEYVPINYDLARVSRFKNINRILIKPMNFEGLPEYETTDDDEEEEEENIMSQKGLNELHHVDLNSPPPTNMKHIQGTPIHMMGNGQANLQNAAKKPMNQKDYQQSM